MIALVGMVRTDGLFDRSGRTTGYCLIGLNHQYQFFLE
jgi:hypothetical protein